MDKNTLSERFINLSLDIIQLFKLVPQEFEFEVIRKQIIRSSMSAGANYRAACRAKSTADFIYKLKVVAEEIDETMYWMEVTERLFENDSIGKIKKETNELTSIIVSSIKTSIHRSNKS